MQLREFYENVNGDYEDIMARIGNEMIIKKFLLKFPNEPSYQRLITAVEGGDIEESFVAAHTLKGVVANLSLKKLYDDLSLLIEQLRPRTQTADPQLLEAVKVSYEIVIREIEGLEE